MRIDLQKIIYSRGPNKYTQILYACVIVQSLTHEQALTHEDVVKRPHSVTRVPLERNKMCSEPRAVSDPAHPAHHVCIL